MRTPALVVSWLVATTSLAGLAAADATYASPLDELTLRDARADFLALSKRADIEPAVAERMIMGGVIATTSDTGCPGVDIDVVNASPHTVWNIEVKIDQVRGDEQRTDRLHVPYLRARTRTRVTVDCLGSTGLYGSARGISLGYLASGSASLAEALPRLADQHNDTRFNGVALAPATDMGTRLEAALAMDDEPTARELVAEIARSGVGGDALSAAIGVNRTVAKEAAAALGRLPAAQHARLVRTLLASSEALTWAAQLRPAIDRVCAGPRADAIALWILAQGNVTIRFVDYRDRIRARCKVGRGDTRALVAVLDREPALAGPALDAVDPATFEAVLASVRAPHDTHEVSKALVAYLRDGTSAERFDRAIAAVSPVDERAVLFQVLTSAEPTIAARRAAWAAPLLAADHAPHVVDDLAHLLVEGKIAVPALRDAVRARCDQDPATLQAVAVSFAESRSPIFDPKQLAAAGVDVIDVLTLTGELGDCTSMLALLRNCLPRLAGFKLRDGRRLMTAARSAIRPSFLTKLDELVAPVNDRDELMAFAGELTAVGIEPAAVVHRLCFDVEHELDRGEAPEAVLARVAKLDPHAPCIAATRDKVAWRGRKALMMTLLAIAALVVPLPVGGLLLRRRYRKLQAELPEAVADDAGRGRTRDDRLGRPGLGRALGDGVRAASRELADTAAQPALAAIDAAILDAATATVQRAVIAGDAATLVVRRPDAPGAAAVYVVALPIRDPRPQAVQRYLGAPWPDHLAAIQRAVGAPVLALIVLCDPGAAEASLLVGYLDATTTLDPDALLDARQARERRAHSFRHVMTLTATPPDAT